MATGIILAMIVGSIAVIAALVCWVGALITVWHQPGWETEKKALWFIVIFVAGILGATVFYFVVKRKPWGVVSLILLIALPVLYFAFIGTVVARSFKSAYDGRDGYLKPGNAEESSLIAPRVSTIRQLVVRLSEQTSSGETGTAVLTAEGQTTRVNLQLVGAPTSGPQPAHIHAGACPSPGAVKYPLASPVNGYSDTVLDVSLATLLSQRPLAINVHQSKEMATRYVSCGNVPAR